MACLPALRAGLGQALLLAAVLLSCAPGALAMCGSTIMRQDFSAHPGAYQHQSEAACSRLFPTASNSRRSGDGQFRQAGLLLAATGTCERLQLGEGNAKMVHKKGTGLPTVPARSDQLTSDHITMAMLHCMQCVRQPENLKDMLQGVSVQRR